MNILLQERDWFHFVMASLCVWRITHLLSQEDGPFDIIFIIRKKAGAGFFGNLLDCFYCLSIWTALPFGFWIGNNWKEKAILWLAISGFACLLQKATEKNNTASRSFYEEK